MPLRKQRDVIDMIFALHDPCLIGANICQHVLKSALHIDLFPLFVEHFKQIVSKSTKSARESRVCMGQ